MKSWKTTVAGVCAILIAVAGAVQAVVGGGSIDYPSVIAAVMAGIGLIMAKDSNVTGGTVVQ